jgi:hypothetical protein
MHVHHAAEHKGRYEAGSATLAEIIKQYRVRMALVAGSEPKRKRT